MRQAKFEGTKVDKLKFDLDMSLKAVDTLGKGLNKFEQYNRRENVEIIGLPDSIKNVELEDVVINISATKPALLGWGGSKSERSEVSLRPNEAYTRGGCKPPPHPTPTPVGPGRSSGRF